MLKLASVLSAALLLGGWSSMAGAQEVEPNDTCATAQQLGVIRSAQVIDATLRVGEVDFFRFTGEQPVDLSARFAGQFLASFYDVDCALVISIPIEQIGRLGYGPGSFVIGIAAGFDGSTGPYQLTLEPHR